MSSLAQLSSQLQALHDSLREIQTLISRLQNWSSQPGSEPLAEGADSARLELAQDIHDSLKQLSEDLDLLRSESEDLNNDSSVGKRKSTSKEQERERIVSGIARLDQELEEARSSYRQAQLHAKRASEAAKAQERQALLRSVVETTYTDTAISNGQPYTGHRRQRTQQLTEEELRVNASSDVTAALRRTHDLLSTELSRSRFAQETFDESTEALKELSEKYSDLDTILKNSKSLLSTLITSQKSDTWYLETAFYILIATLVWLVFRRVLYGPFIRLPLLLWSISKTLIYWTVLTPFYYFCVLIGVIRSEPIPIKDTFSEPSTTRTPLIIKPSASDFLQPIPSFMADQMRAAGGVPAGAGGRGAKAGKDESLSGIESEKIAQMAEQNKREAVYRGDGVPLSERGDTPKNPKKKNFEHDPAAEQAAQIARDEL